MNPGILAHDRINFEKPVKINTGSTIKEGFQVVYSDVPANAQHGAGMRTYGKKTMYADEVVTDYVVRFIIRYHYRDKIASNMVIVHKGNRYRILDINPRFAQKDVAIISEPITGGNLS